jgi:DNA-directed RNA polymerase subunit N (RpoN/RPB10)
MLVPVLCFTCGCAVGDVAPLFRHMRAARARAILAERGTTATRAGADAGLRVDCGDILDRLGVDHDCCRKTLITAMVFTDYYH